VGETVSSDPSRIGAAGVSLEDGSLPSPGENEIALSIAALREEVIEADGFTGSLAYGFSEMVSEVGMKKASTDDMKEYQQVIVAQLKDERSSISGVNLDEEMIKMMKYQWGYQAAAKIIKAGQEMLDTILEMV
jgi:flagellar hook-associated protein 1 FlgK